VEFTGVVFRKPFGAGSKSERTAVMLRAGGAEYVLRWKGGLAFGDETLEALVGKRVRCRGAASGYTFLMTECEEVPDDPS